MMKGFLRSILADTCDCEKCAGMARRSAVRQSAPVTVPRYDGLDVPTYLRRKLAIPGITRERQ
jgi:hypothetical protein